MSDKIIAFGLGMIICDCIVRTIATVLHSRYDNYIEWITRTADLVGFIITIIGILLKVCGGANDI